MMPSVLFRQCRDMRANNPHGEDQGFVTSTNRFVDRKEAYRLHFPDLTEPGELHSDDLY
jgi:hypothetical protein